MAVPAFPTLHEHLQCEHDGLRERTQSRELLVAGRFLKVVRDQVMLPDGKLSSREFVQHPGAVVVVPLLEGGRLLLERQYRHPVERVMIEFPAGKLDDGEPGLRCAQRELLEETGCVAREWAFAGTMHNCIGYSDEHIDIWFARDLQFQGQALDDGEALRVYAASLPDLLQRARSGELTDAKTLTALLWLQQVHAGQWALDWYESAAKA